MRYNRDQMPSNEYLRLRNIAQINDATLADDHPCRVCRTSKCCTGDFAITDEDAGLITDAIRRRSIKPDIVERAKKRKKAEDCVFLNSANKCDIYEQRPLICIATGSGGVPRSEAAARRVSNSHITHEVGLPFKELTSSMCSRGHRQLENEEKGATMQSIFDSLELMRYIASHAATTVNNLLKPDESSKQRNRRR